MKAVAGVVMSLAMSLHAASEVRAADRRDSPCGAGKSALVSGKEDVRYVRIQLGSRRGGDDGAALLGHELFHALEIASAPDVRDDETLEALYRRVGFARARPHQFDTDAAQQIERRIRNELGERTCG